MKLAKTVLPLAAAAVLTSACNSHDIKPVSYNSEGVCSDEVKVEVVKPKVMLVLDKSGSMAMETWDDDGDPSTAEVTRWHTLHGVVDGLLEARESQVEFGATLFPSAGASGDDYAKACLMNDTSEVGVALDNRERIMATLPGADAEVEGGTPATAGISRALDHLLDIDTEDPLAMILVTDGAANCMEGLSGYESMETYDENLPSAVAEAHGSHGIPTYVVGIDIRDEEATLPKVNPFDKLNEVAQMGGAPRDGSESFYNVSDAAELQAALDEIAGSLSCAIELDQLPPDENAMLVTVGGEQQEEVSDCDTEDGWRWAPDAAEGTVEMCGSACETFQATGEVDVDFLCA